MTLLQRAVAEAPDMKEQDIVLLHCPGDFGLSPTECPRHCLPTLGEGGPLAVDEGELPEPPLLCYSCWNRPANP